ncbi:L-amino acid amidase [Rhypophila decipiens]|uniref:L-amino acid amidase n=1 Tax=Rhypophila decipiens TaxID=261697 RepID=A0AAN6YC35_9PEZI|nr:L-amino acid amidase [Rhypophila decipiens]
MTVIPTTTGEIPFKAPGTDKPCKTWYKIVGDIESSDKTPLITLHGGPGAGYNYLTPLIDIYTQYKIPVIFYDQIGCGQSTHFPERMGDNDFWTFDLFLSELDNLIDTLGLREKGFYLLGQSWGGVLAGICATSRLKGLKKVIIASGPASLPLYVKGTKRLLSRLPEEVRKVLEEADRKGDYESPEYEKAAGVYYDRHVCRLEHPYPEDLQASFENLKADPSSYITVQGPSEFVITGWIKDWEGWQDAHKVEVDTLLLNAKYDEVTDICVEPWFRHIPRIKWVTFENSSHMAHWEERERYMQVVGEFLASSGQNVR